MSTPFKLPVTPAKKDIDIEDLFKDKKDRHPSIRDLLAPQADIVRNYQEKYSDYKDIGIELPTGSGKTLIGLLIGEWRRVTKGQRILYLCPTKQLVNQVFKQSIDYDINTRVFTGPKRDFNKTDLALYRSSKTIALSTYSGLFNTNPEFSDAQTIILDDTHGAESYIGSLWSIEIERDTHTELYKQVLGIYEKDLTHTFIQALQNEKRDLLPYRTEKVPFGAYYRSLSVLRELLESSIKIDDPDLYFPWSLVRLGLHACHVYVSYDSILIRPYIPPTLTHNPFKQAQQRIYMSATLGRGGELERITGIENIHRIPAPKTYESRGIGRRLYLFPDLAEDFNINWVSGHLQNIDRTLVLTPNGYVSRQFQRFIEATTKNMKILGPWDIEETMNPFKESKNSVLLLANRFDGIDLPDGICKQMILVDLPSGINIQETFIEERLGLDILLRERINTRIQQASGRCTRSDADSAAVIMVGKRLLNYCILQENQSIFHPEMRAEIQFSLDQQPYTLSKMDAMMDSFFKKDEHWHEAEKYIAQRRSEETPPDISVTKMLSDVVRNEVAFSYAMWIEDFDEAIKLGRQVADNLNDPKLSTYSALWNYFTASACRLNYNDEEFMRLGYHYLNEARKACRTVPWFPHALRSLYVDTPPPSTSSELQPNAIENIVEFLKRLGAAGPYFKNKIDEVEELLNDAKSKNFDRGLIELGKLLGFNSPHPSGKGAPDACWYIEDRLLLIFESKSQEKPESSISIRNCLQTLSYINWAKGSDQLRNISEMYPILVTPKSTIDKDALKHGTDIYYVNTSEILPLFKKAKQMLIEIRTAMTTKIDDPFREKVLSTITRMNLTPEEVRNHLTSKFITNLPTE